MPRLIKKGQTDVSDYVFIVDAVDGSPKTGLTITELDLQYVRNGASPSAKVDATSLAAIDSTHADNKMFEVDSTDQPGLYRVDWPDAAFATGVGQVICTVKGTGIQPAHKEYQLVDFDPEDAIRMGLTALPNANADAAGGLPISDLGGLDMDTMAADAARLTAARAGALTDWIDGGRLDLLIDAITTHLTDLKGTGFIKDTHSLKQILDDVTGLNGDAMRGTDGANTDKTGFSLSTAGVLAIWHQALSAIVTAGSVGKLFKDEITSVRMATLTDWIDGGRLDLLIDAITTHLTDLKGTGFIKDTHSLKQILDDVTGLNGDAMRGTDGANTDKTGFSLSTAGVLAIWHQALSAIVTAGSVGKLFKDEITSVRMATLTDWIDGGRLDLLIDAITTHLTDLKGTGFIKDTHSLKQILDDVTGLNGDAMRGTDGANTDKTGFSLSTTGVLAIWHQALSAIVTAGSVGKLFKDEITSVRMAVLTDLIDGGRLDLILDAIKSEADKLSSTAATESYAADGAEATLSQLLYMIWSVLNSLKFVSTTGTARKLDGTSPAMTFTVDDADNPTDINRTT